LKVQNRHSWYNFLPHATVNCRCCMRRSTYCFSWPHLLVCARYVNTAISWQSTTLQNNPT
jgi:hypothetical protein